MRAWVFFDERSGRVRARLALSPTEDSFRLEYRGASGEGVTAVKDATRLATALRFFLLERGLVCVDLRENAKAPRVRGAWRKG